MTLNKCTNHTWNNSESESDFILMFIFYYFINNKNIFSIHFKLGNMTKN